MLTERSPLEYMAAFAVVFVAGWVGHMTYQRMVAVEAARLAKMVK